MVSISSTSTTQLTNVKMRIKRYLNRIPQSRTTTTCLCLILTVIITNTKPVECRALDTSDFSQDTNLTKHRLLIETNSIQRQVDEAGSASSDHNRSLKRVFLSNRTVTCNDGSQAGFYLRKSTGSKKWVVFLEGGWHCYDTKSCRARWMKLRHLMTSAQWPDTRDVGGILSSIPDENPFWHNANHVLVPYCSSDSWSGTKAQADTRDGWRFMGSSIIRQVIADLIPMGLGRASGSELLLVGSSAGGLGVMLNLDRINKFLHQEKNLKVQVRGVSDSGWFLDREPYTPAAIGSSESVHQGWKMWEGQLPEACVEKHPVEPWRCYFGYRLYPTLESPLFVFQWLFDEAQMRADNVGAPVTQQQWNYIHEMGGALKNSLENVSAVFAPSCIGHAVLSKRDWVNIKIDNVSLPMALRCWEQSTRRKRNNKLRRATESSLAPFEKRKHNQRHKHPEEAAKTRRKQRLTKEEREQRRRHNQQRRRNQNNNKNPRRLRTTTSNPNRFGSIPENGTHTNRPHKNRRKNDKDRAEQRNTHNSRNGSGSGSGSAGLKKRRRKQQQLLQQQQLEQPVTKSQKATDESAPQKCNLRYLERCSWPQCNHSCPVLTNPITGEEMGFLELLTSFGVDIERVAKALGVDMETLRNMGHSELLDVLTQQVS